MDRVSPRTGTTLAQDIARNRAEAARGALEADAELLVRLARRPTRAGVDWRQVAEVAERIRATASGHADEPERGA